MPNNWDNVLPCEVALLHNSIKQEDCPEYPKNSDVTPIREYTITKTNRQCVCHKKTKSVQYCPESWEVLVKSSSPQATKFLNDLHNNAPPEWVLPLHLDLPPIPLSMRKFVQDTLQNGVSHASHDWLESKITRPPSTISQYVSGTTDKSQRFRDPNIGSFFASLFHVMQLSSCTEVELVGWDLYHGHMFIHATPIKETEEDVTLQCEVGILFHAKEFPKEYGLSKYNPIYPIGHAKQGGDKDPRHGTKVSVSDPDFHLRNYIWLLSTNKIYLLDPHSESFDKRLLCSHGGEKFKTCVCNYFTSNPLGDINYFPSAFTKQDNVPYCQETARNAAIYLKEYKENGFAPKEILDSKLLEGSAYLWYTEQVARVVRHSCIYAQDLFFCPLSGFSTALQLYDAYVVKSGALLADVLAKAEEFVLDDTLRLIEYVRDRTERLPCEEIYFAIDSDIVIDAINHRKREIIEKREEYNRNQRKELMEKNIEEEHAAIALKLTSYEGLQSSYKSLNLLGATFAKYRDEEDLKTYGDDNYDIYNVFEVMKQTFYSWSTLYALRLQYKEGLSREEAVEQAQQYTSDVLLGRLQKTFDEYDPEKEAEYYKKKEEEEKVAQETSENEKREIECENVTGEIPAENSGALIASIVI